MSAAAKEIRRRSGNEEQQRKERATARAKLGPLGRNLVLQTARMRYNQQVQRMLEWLKDESHGQKRLQDALDGDAVASEYAEHLWESGRPKQWAAEFPCGLRHYAPETRSRLQGSE